VSRLRTAWHPAAWSLLLCAGATGLQAQGTAGRIPYETYTLPNGLRVVLSEDHSAPVVSVNVWYHVGSANEVPRRSGFAHLFEHMMFQGSAHVRKAEHFQLIERAGGDMNGSTNDDRTNYFQVLPSNRLNLGLWLEADRMRSLAITAENFENQRQAVKEERRLRIDNQPYAGAFITGFTMPFDSATCFAYAHTTIGDMADLDSARLEDVQAFFDQYYAPNNAVLTVAGDVDPAQARALIEQYFGGIPRGRDIPRPSCEARFGAGARRMSVTDANANLPAVLYVYPVPPRASADAPALELLMTILGGGESSRLNRVLVRQERAALGAGGFSQFRVGPGSVLVFGIANQGVPSARLDSLMAAEVERLRSDTLAESELAKARNQYRAGAVRARQTTMGVAETLQGALRYLGDLEAANTEVARYMAVTTADLRRVAAQYLAPANRTTVIVNPPSAGGN
jgi:predicted Zn-dependent peptidase